MPEWFKKPDGTPMGPRELQEYLQEAATAFLKSNGCRKYGEIRKRPADRRKHWRKGRLRQSGPALKFESVAQGEGTLAVYVITAPQYAIKIGISDNPDRRLREIQTGFPHRLSIYGAIRVTTEEARYIERAAHLELAEHRLNGEWFSIGCRQGMETVVRIAERLRTATHR